MSYYKKQRFLHTVTCILACVIIGRVLYRAVYQCHNGEGFRVGGGVHGSYTFPVQTGGIFYSPCHRHQTLESRQIEETNGLVSPPKDTGKAG